MPVSAPDLATAFVDYYAHIKEAEIARYRKDSTGQPEPTRSPNGSIGNISICCEMNEPANSTAHTYNKILAGYRQYGECAQRTRRVRQREGIKQMMKRWIFCRDGAGTRALGPAMAQDKTVKIGFISTFSGPTAVIGNDMSNSFELGLDHLGRKLGGLPVEVIYEDDTQKPEVGVQKTQKLIESDHVDFVVGYIWSNVLLASLKPLVDSKTMTVVTNAGASQFAGELCSPYVFSTSWQNDQTPAAIGMLHESEGRENRLS